MYFQCESSEVNRECKKKPYPYWWKIWRSDSGRSKCRKWTDLFQVSPMTIYRAAKEGSLPSFKVGSSLRFDPKAVIAWLKRQMCLLSPV